MVAFHRPSLRWFLMYLEDEAQLTADIRNGPITVTRFGALSSSFGKLRHEQCLTIKPKMGW